LEKLSAAAPGGRPGALEAGKRAKGGTMILLADKIVR